MPLNKVRVGGTPLISEAHSQQAVPRGDTIDPADMIEEMQRVCPEMNVDIGARHNIWHPEIAFKQGLFYGCKHICSVDRVRMRQWPEWSVTEELVEVPIGVAMAHDDLPIVALNEHGEEDLEHADTAYVFRMKPEDCTHVGWAEVFWMVLKRRVPGFTKRWFEQTFRVSMDWVAHFKNSPLVTSYNQIEQRTPGERIVDYGQHSHSG